MKWKITPTEPKLVLFSSINLISQLSEEKKREDTNY